MGTKKKPLDNYLSAAMIAKSVNCSRTMAYSLIAEAAARGVKYIKRPRLLRIEEKGFREYLNSLD